MRFADLIEKHNDEIAALETWDNGKTYEQASQIEIPMIVRLIRYYAGGCYDERRSISLNGSLVCVSTYDFYSSILQDGQIRFMVSLFRLMGRFTFKLCTNRLVWLDRLSHGTSLS